MNLRAAVVTKVASLRRQLKVGADLPPTEAAYRRGWADLASYIHNALLAHRAEVQRRAAEAFDGRPLPVERMTVKEAWDESHGVGAHGKRRAYDLRFLGAALARRAVAPALPDERMDVAEVLALVQRVAEKGPESR